MKITAESHEWDPAVFHLGWVIPTKIGIAGLFRYADFVWVTSEP